MVTQEQFKNAEKSIIDQTNDLIQRLNATKDTPLSVEELMRVATFLNAELWHEPEQEEWVMILPCEGHIHINILEEVEDGVIHHRSYKCPVNEEDAAQLKYIAELSKEKEAEEHWNE